MSARKTAKILVKQANRIPEYASTHIAIANMSDLISS